MTRCEWEAAADLIVVGSGVAGLTAALRARAVGLRVLVVTKDDAAVSNTRWAQGGIAVVFDTDRARGDSPGAHAADTVVAGAGLCDPGTVGTVVEEGADALGRLLARGAVFDTDTDGVMTRTREGGHSAFRVVHAGGDATGAEVQRALLATARAEAVPLLDHHVAADIVRTSSGAVGGLLVLDGDDRAGFVRAPAVLLASGGGGHLYRDTTNPAVATADGLATALRAGAVVSDLEFVQFHPTVLYVPGATGSRPLVTEAVRGEGAVLVDTHGRPVMAGVHLLGDLAPRDVVSLGVTRRMAEISADHVLLDATGIDRFAVRFPTVNTACVAAGIDPTVEPIPVAPAAHFCCGGVDTTVDGRTSVPGLYAAGEVARTGLHGANRLASNSLLEGLVVGSRVARAVASDLADGSLDLSHAVEPAAVPAEPLADRDVLQAAMSEHAAIGRDGPAMAAALAAIESSSVVRPLRTRRAVEDASLTLVARTLLAAAMARTESRGAHVRTDYPDRDDARWALSQRMRLDVSGQPILLAPTPEERAA